MQPGYGFPPHAYRSAAGTLFVTANAIRRGLFQKVGGFGFPGSFHGTGEDTELAGRLSRAGASICIDGCAAALRDRDRRRLAFDG